jgi:hypothetical protein
MNSAARFKETSPNGSQTSIQKSDRAAVSVEKQFPIEQSAIRACLTGGAIDRKLSRLNHLSEKKCHRS